MNLVAKEFAVVSERPGTLVVSETAGVAEEVRGSAQLVSPLDVETTAQALGAALDMPREERADCLAGLRDRSPLDRPRLARRPAGRPPVFRPGRLAVEALRLPARNPASHAAILPGYEARVFRQVQRGVRTP